MKTAQKLVKQLSRISEGTTFCYSDLAIEPHEYFSAAKALERLIGKGFIKRVSTGIFYKPKQTVFGEIRPKEEELVKPYLFDDGKRRAYITGTTLYNRMGLTTQVPATIKIASRDKRIFASIGSLKGKPVKSYVDVTDENYPLLELLDALKDFKQIPDLDKKAGIALLKDRLNKLAIKEKRQLLKYALHYPPRVRAFLGAILETAILETIHQVGKHGVRELEVLKESLNPLSTYTYGLSKDLLPTVENWNLK
ncbi:DUF6088 family protein [Xanthocytophaga flava]|uniref:DUF6088 family protein n=1 Tax=Xanthocytophaga flava TaxID=3048013 RepID=UPI0028D23325|nr:DUF6088 family protein [Xanthocytophaga flavus]MDJ1470353.1 DUF6088 family protein [Xanthocytophaga flavus]